MRENNIRSVKHAISFSIFLCMMVSVIGFGVAIYGYIQLYGKKEVKTSQELGLENPYLFVAPGTNANQLLDQLQAREGKGRDKRGSLYLKLHSEYTKIKFGSYEIEPGATVESVLKQIVEGKVVQLQVSLIPGQKFSTWKSMFKNVKELQNGIEDKTDKEIAEALDLQKIDGAKDLSNLEGYFLPNSYFYNRNGNSIDVLKSANKDLMRVLNDAWATRSPTAQAKNKYQLLIFASIIEKETNIDNEYNIVSAVYNNRVKQGMRLQADPTLLYLKTNNNITRKDLTTDNPYNTYTRSGLPPTPISMPSQRSIYAAANPANVNYLFMVAKGDAPGHNFSVTYAEHTKAVKVYLETLKKK